VSAADPDDAEPDDAEPTDDAGAAALLVDELPPQAVKPVRATATSTSVPPRTSA
jgi:3-hydroxy-3-methylglutaryl CoA synthase